MGACAVCRTRDVTLYLLIGKDDSFKWVIKLRKYVIHLLFIGNSSEVA